MPFNAAKSCVRFMHCSPSSFTLPRHLAITSTVRPSASSRAAAKFWTRRKVLSWAASSPRFSAAWRCSQFLLRLRETTLPRSFLTAPSRLSRVSARLHYRYQPTKCRMHSVGMARPPEFFVQPGENDDAESLDKFPSFVHVMPRAAGPRLRLHRQRALESHGIRLEARGLHRECDCGHQAAEQRG